MPQPQRYSRSFSFNDFQATAPATPLPGYRIDDELSGVADTLQAVCDNLELIQRDDGKLANGVVGLDAMSPAALLAFASAGRGGAIYRGLWTAGTGYAAGDFVANGSDFYMAALAHTATTLADDIAAGDLVRLTDNSAIFERGNPVPVAGVAAGFSWIFDDPAFPLAAEGGIWSGPSPFGFGFNRTFGPADGGAGSPAGTLFIKATNNGSSADVLPVVFETVVTVPGSVGFGFNTIVRGDGKTVGGEIDLIPRDGTATFGVGSIGWALNVFDKPFPGPIFQSGGLNGGSFNDGFILGGIAPTGTGLALGIGEVADSLINGTTGTYSTAPIVLGVGPQGGIKWFGDGGLVYYDGLNQRDVLPNGGVYAWRDYADTQTLVSIDEGGNVFLEAGGELRFAAAATSLAATAGAQVLPANPVGFLNVTIDGTACKIPYYGA